MKDNKKYQFISDEELITNAGLEIIDRYGWELYREEVAKISYYELIKGKATHFKKVRRNLLFHIKLKNQIKGKYMLFRAYGVKTKLDRLNQYNLYTTYLITGRKIVVTGNNVNSSIFPLRRVYITPPLHISQEVYLSLVNTFISAGLINDITIVYNLEALQSDENSKENYASNIIVLYIWQKSSKKLTDIFKLLLTFKKAATKGIWPDSSEWLWKDFEKTMTTLAIPLASGISLVEMMGNLSYHDGIYLELVKELTNKKAGIHITPNIIMRALQKFSVKTRKYFSCDKNRLLAMPALIYQEE